MFGGEGDRGIQKYPEWGDVTLLGANHVGRCAFVGRGIETRRCLLHRLPSNRLRGSCRFGLRLFSLESLPDTGHFKLLGRTRDRLSRGILVWGWRGGGLDDKPPRIT